VGTENNDQLHTLRRTETLLDGGDVLLHLALKVHAALTAHVFDHLQRLELDRVVLVLDARDEEVLHLDARVVAVLRHARDLPVQVAGRGRVILARGAGQQRLVHRSCWLGVSCGSS